MKLIATAAETRKAALPNVPTMREQGYDVGMWGYLWFWGPAGMPRASRSMRFMGTWSRRSSIRT